MRQVPILLSRCNFFLSPLAIITPGARYENS